MLRTAAVLIVFALVTAVLMPGQRETSDFEMKQASSRPPSTRMSSQEEWLATISSGCSSTHFPVSWTRMPRIAHTMR